MYGEEVQILVNVQQKLRKGIALNLKFIAQLTSYDTDQTHGNTWGTHGHRVFFINVCVDKTA